MECVCCTVVNLPGSIRVSFHEACQSRAEYAWSRRWEPQDQAWRIVKSRSSRSGTDRNGSLNEQETHSDWDDDDSNWMMTDCSPGKARLPRRRMCGSPLVSAISLGSVTDGSGGWQGGIVEDGRILGGRNT